ncbi:MAG TPA: hypothetical protein VN238_04870 [Solirubrobacteraceae bacterium]|nr:hypothetical protein [Solirubrobacteraceae bacterium]
MATERERPDALGVTLDGRPVAHVGSADRQSATMRTLRALAPADGGWLADQHDLRVSDREVSVEPLP